MNSSTNENRDSGVADVEVCPCLPTETSQSFDVSETSGLNLKRSALSNSLLDIHDQSKCQQPPSQQIYSTSLDHTDSL